MYDTVNATSGAVTGENIKIPRGACVRAGTTELMNDTGKATSRSITNENIKGPYGACFGPR
ncbi:hypothetical protein DPMN_155134 [Dreissena polymorpha]|uniref:Uncharacterized protein n=1 Tax=Dreissena polymorpha TaxID=45954 RepID=A0A9D4JAL9_DREPO|nr:hypothetical protein DPMN_155134 [Dreissena polymorpha]